MKSLRRKTVTESEGKRENLTEETKKNRRQKITIDGAYTYSHLPLTGGRHIRDPGYSFGHLADYWLLF